MSEAPPIVYVIDPSIAVTGGFVAMKNAARILKNDARLVVVLPRGSTIAPEELHDYWRVDYLPLIGIRKHWRALLRYIPALLMDSWRLRMRMRRDGATRLVLNDFYLMHGVILRLLGFRGYIVSWVRCNPTRLMGFVATPLLTLARVAANRMVTVSNFVRSFLPPAYPVEIVHDFYAGPTRAPRIWGANETKPFIYVSNYIMGKGHDVALEAFLRAADQDSTITLAFYGGDMGLQKNREYRKALETRAHQSGHAARITFGEFLQDTYPMLEQSFAALNFSSSEGFPNVVLEASGAGLPVIATAAGGTQEILRDGVTGYLIPVGDVEAATARILTLAKDPALAANLGEAGAARIAQEFPEQRFREGLRFVLNLTQRF